MKDARVEKLADILVGYSTKIARDDIVLIRASYLAEPLIAALYQRCLEQGAHPVLKTSIPSLEPVFYRFAQEHQLDFVPESERWMWKNCDVNIYITAESNTRALSNVPPERMSRSKLARKDLLDDFFHRAAEGKVRWNVTLFPTEAIAMEAQMSLAEYEDFFYAACLVDSPDPVAEWLKVAERNQRIVDWISPRNEIHIEGEGTDLYLEVGGRTWEPSSGHENFPDGEIFTGPIETKTRGHVSFSYPAIYDSVAVEGARLEFQDGKVVGASARQNEEYLVKMLDTDPGARVLGELGIGTNYGIDRFTGEILLDEKMGGTVHLALGASYPETGGTNDSAIHWDMVCDLRKGGRITVDGEVLLEDGRLLV
ncbi:MAG: aminopeptidase [Actinomycetota bacterium]